MCPHQSGAGTLAVEDWAIVHLVFRVFCPINPLLQTSVLSPSQTRPSMVQWLNPQSPTTPSSNPAVTPSSPRTSPFPFSPAATIVDKPPERYVEYDIKYDGSTQKGLDGPVCCDHNATCPGPPSTLNFKDSAFNSVSGLCLSSISRAFLSWYLQGALASRMLCTYQIEPMAQVPYMKWYSLGM